MPLVLWLSSTSTAPLASAVAAPEPPIAEGKGTFEGPLCPEQAGQSKNTMIAARDTGNNDLSNKEHDPC